MGISDVHRDMGMKCWDCHSDGDIHGDGTEYTSMLEPGAIDADCENCHVEGGLAGAQTAEHAGYNPHGDRLSCSACHAQTVITCYNCHFESQVEAHVKRARQPLSDFVILVNRAKDGKVGTASFQSVSYQGSAFAAFGPYAPHTITREGRTCQDCHANFGGDVAAIEQYNETGQIKFVTFNEDGTLSWIRGVIPMPEDYETTFKMDFITFDGDVSTPAGEDNLNWSPIGKDTWDSHQMFFATPLSREQMEKLGFESGAAAAVAGEEAAVPAAFSLQQNYPNPFNSSTTVPYQLSETGLVRLEIFDLNGQKVATLIDHTQASGRYQVSWDGTDDQGQAVSTGTYLISLRLGDSAQVSKMVLIK
jgi:hypothetical protein